ncbi:hypothetical protein Acsp05_20330 [Actinokineospora sp. NBRC 105648]|nr:hypothetical protein Acsp05_20330 [Actinokineospora sp. NBRC 105648]
MRRRTKRAEQRSTLVELVDAELASPLQRVRVTSLVDRIGHQVAEQLAPTLALPSELRELGSIPADQNCKVGRHSLL